MAYGTVNADVIQSSVANTSLGAGNASIMKNRIINGAMVIDQRKAGASVTPTSSGYTLDRWRAALSVSSKFSVQQSSTVPAGFKNSLLATSLSAYTVGASEVFLIQQYVEGLNWYDLGWGTADAKTVTLSFWVRSSLTGTFGGSFRNVDGTRSYPFAYTISSANTWEQKSVTVTGDITGTWATDNTTAVRLSFSLGAGSSASGTAGSWAAADYASATGATSVVGTNGATFYITGVQLEVGSSATGYEYRQYGQELALCQRYYEKSYDQGTVPGSSVTGTYAGLHITATVNPTSSSYMGCTVQYRVPKRTSVSIAYWDAAGNASKYSTLTGGGLALTNNVGSVGSAYPGDCQYGFTVLPGTGLMALLGWAASAEL